MRGRLRAMARRRERVVPVVPRRTRRRWERASPDDWAYRLHLLYLRHRDRVQPAYFARTGSYPMPRRGLPRAWRWYAVDVAVQALRLVRRHGPAVRAAVGVPLRRQLWDLLRLSVRTPARPECYYTFEWYRPEQQAQAGEYLHRHETKGGLYAMLGIEMEEQAPLNDKARFAAHAGAAGLAVVPTVAVIEAGTATGEPAPADLFVKQRAGKGGRGAQRWVYAAGEYHREGAVVPQAGFLPWLAAEVGPDLLVQPCLANHPDLADLALAAAVTCRVVTILDEAGEPEPVIAIFRMPAVRDAVVDNMHRGGLAAPVEIGSGVLAPAAGYTSDRFSEHPVTGAVIAGRKLPLWDEVRQLVVAAHQAFPPRALVGWDVSIGPAGPVLVEGNEQPGVDGLQRLHRRPLGSHRFGQLLAYHLERQSPADSPLRPDARSG